MSHHPGSTVEGDEVLRRREYMVRPLLGFAAKEGSHYEHMSFAWKTLRDTQCKLSGVVPCSLGPRDCS
jgi:hypothetical protein